MALMKQSPIIFIFNSALSSGCDYVVQTIRIVSQGHPVFGLALGDIVSLPRLLTEKDKWIVRAVNGAIIFRPVSILPFIRFRGVRMFTYIGSAIFLRVYVGIRYLGKNKTLWFFEPFHMPMLLSVFLGYTSLYDCVDYYPGFNKTASREHYNVMKRASYVFANSQPLATVLRKVRRDVYRVPLGFATELFINRAQVRHAHDFNHTHPVVGFVGGISDRLDFPLLTSIIRSLPQVRFVFVGPREKNVFETNDSLETSLQGLRRLKNFEWMQAVPKNRIPNTISKFDICIIPYKVENLFNKYSFPMKSLEYFAMGKPVVSTAIESLRPYCENKLLFFMRNSTDFQRAYTTIKKYGWHRDRQKKQKSIAMNQSWGAKVFAILTLVG